MAFLITTDDTNVEVGKDVEILFTGIYPYPNEMKVFVNGVQKTNGISYNYTSQGMVRSFTISFSESGTYDVYVIYDDTILLQHSNTLTFTTKDNKTNIILNHKEVQSIQLTDGGIIYQRPIFKQIGSFTVSSSKDIISFADNESSTITATVLDNNNNPISNEFILFEVDDREYIDAFTDENGEASIIYEAKGWGDVKITVDCRNLSETVIIEDCQFYSDGSSVSSSITIPSNTTFTSNGEYITLTTSTTGQKNIIFPTNISNSENWSFEMEIAKSGVTQSLTSQVNGNSYWNINDMNLLVWKFNDESGNHTQNITGKVGDVFKWVYENGTLKHYYNTQLIASKSQTYQNPIQFCTYTNKDGSTPRVQYLKNIKIKKLQSINIDIDNPILSYVDGDTAILTATITPIEEGRNVKIYKDDLLVATEQIDENGQVSYTYKSQGVGDVEFEFKCGLLTKTFVVQDCKDYISGETDQSSKFGSSITLRTGSSTLSYDSTNKHYILTVGTAGESFLPIQSCTGLDDFTIEFDAQVNYNSAYGVGSVIYSASNNWGAIGVHQQSCTYGKTVNGTYTYSSETVSITGNTWLHFKITVTDDKVKLEILNGTTLIASHTETYDSSWFNNSTKYGLDHMWSSGRATPFKNIKIKPL